jgi:hypothetical protein
VLNVIQDVRIEIRGDRRCRVPENVRVEFHGHACAQCDGRTVVRNKQNAPRTS